MLFVKYLIGLNLYFVSSQLNLYYTDSVSTNEKKNEYQHDCLRAAAYMNENNNIREVISYCMSELSSKFIIESVDFHRKLTFEQLAKENISSQQLFLWSAPIDLIEHYQYYLNELSTKNDLFLSNKIFYNCTWPRFGPECQYELYTSRPSHSSTYDIIHDFYKNFQSNSTSLTCYEHLQCNNRLLTICLDWSDICDGKIDCLDDGIDEENCWQLEINECNDDEYRCQNGQCISKLFYRDNGKNVDCLDGSSDYILPNFFQEQYRTSEPSFIREDMICKDTPLTSSCIIERQELLLKTIYSNKPNSISEECWLASKCTLRLMISERDICENFCTKNTCANLILNNCPDILYIPNIPILFGHFSFIYKKILEQNLTTLNIWQLYICYTLSYYDTFFHMFPKMKFNNRTCFFYETISYKPYSTNLLDTNKTSLKELNIEFKKYYHIYNYNSRICNRSNMYQCMNSTKCISIYRIFDRTDDCPYMDDENVTIIINSNVIKQVEKIHFKCQTTNTYILRSAASDSVCDCKITEIDWCDDMIWISFNSYMNISFQTICDGFLELFPILINGQNQTDETECEPWQCDNIYTHCNGVWNCLDGADEINCTSSVSTICSSDYRLCVSPYTNQFMCLPTEKFNDGKVDCLGATDEKMLCRPNYKRVVLDNFYCINQTSKSCISYLYLCDSDKYCNYGDDEQFCEQNRTLRRYFGVCANAFRPLQSDVEKFLCNQMEPYMKEYIIHFTLGEITNSIDYQMGNIMLSGSSDIQLLTNQHQSRCRRGLDLRVWLNTNSTTETCLCPPSYYGEQCQYQNQRISLTIAFRAFSSSYRTLFAIVISLIDDTNERIIHSYEQITYLSLSHCKTKFNIYLLYATRPKNTTKQYRIHIDIYEKVSLAYRGSLLLPVDFPFLPIQRLALLVDIPRVKSKTPNYVNYKCAHGKPIEYSNNPDILTFCQCDRGWSGRFCTIEYKCTCASNSECLGIAANNRSICVCRANTFGPRCLLNNSICQNNSICENDGQCIPNDEYLVSEQGFTCICRNGFRGDRCEISDTKLTLSFDKNIVLSQSIFIHFIEVINNNVPVRSTTFRTISFQEDSLTIYWAQPFHLVFIELDNNNYHLTIKQTIYNQSATVNKTINPSDRCPHFREVLNKSIVQWDLIRRIKYYHLPCQNQLLNLSCFYDEVHLCFCYDFHQQRLANCFNFNHNMTFDCSGKNECENDGKCLQDLPECPTRSICMCQPCFYGTRCQFRTNGFGLSLDAILGYHILQDVNLNHQPLIIKISLALTIIFIIAGLIDSIISIMTFQSKVVREVGCGLYLLGSSITSLLIVIMFGLKFFILLLAQMTIISNRSFLLFQCYSIDFLLRIGFYMDQWLNACVAIERAYTIIKGIKFSKKKSRFTAKFVIILLVILIGGSCIHDPISRDLIDEQSNDDNNMKRTWCIVNYGFALQVYNSIINTAHFFGPFLINLISSIILITTISRQKANMHKKRIYKEILREQLKQNRHLLTAPIALVILALPRLIISFVSKCLKSSGDVWVFLTGYFISFIPSILTFVVFILPSKFYKKEFRKTVTHFRMTLQRRLYMI